MMKTTVIDHGMKWYPAGAAYRLDVRLFVIGLFDGDSARNTGVGASRTIRQ